MPSSNPCSAAVNQQVQVAADIDFSQSEQTAESFKPQQRLRITSHPQPAGAPSRRQRIKPRAASPGRPQQSTSRRSLPPRADHAGSHWQRPWPGGEAWRPCRAGSSRRHQRPWSAAGPAHQQYHQEQYGQLRGWTKTVRYTKRNMGHSPPLSAAVVNQSSAGTGKDGKPPSRPCQTPK